MPTELLVAIAAAGFLALVVAGSTKGPVPARGWRTRIVTPALIAVIVAGGQALEQAHLSKRAHALWLLGTITVFLLGFALMAQTRSPPRRNCGTP